MGDSKDTVSYESYMRSDWVRMIVGHFLDSREDIFSDYFKMIHDSGGKEVPISLTIAGNEVDPVEFFEGLGKDLSEYIEERAKEIIKEKFSEIMYSATSISNKVNEIIESVDSISIRRNY